MRIFNTENKQIGQLIFLFLVTLTEKRKAINGMNWTLFFSKNIAHRFDDILLKIFHARPYDSKKIKEMFHKNKNEPS